MARLGDHVEEQRLTLGSEGADGRQLIGVSNDAGLHASTRQPSADLSRYQRVERDWFAYNPMRADVGSIGLADDDGKVGFTSPDYVVFSCRESLDPQYLLAFLKSDYGLEAIVRNSSGAVRKRLYFTGLAEIDLPIPSLAEQRALIDRLADTGEKLAAVGAANPSADELARLRQSILDEAVRGRLTAAWRAGHPVDEPAPALLARIATERAQLVKGKKLRKAKPLPPLTSDEQPFDLPDGWAWCRFGSIVLAAESGKSPKCIDRPVTGDEWGVLKVSAVSASRFREAENKLFSSTVPSDRTAEVREGDFLLSRANTKELVANSVLVPPITSNLLLSDKTVRFKLAAGIEPAYANFVNKTSSVRQHFIQNVTGSSPSMKNLSRPAILSHPFPLPPLAEQTAIATCVTSLLSTCDTLDREITRSAAHATALLRAVLREAFAPAVSTP